MGREEKGTDGGTEERTKAMSAAQQEGANWRRPPPPPTLHNPATPSHTPRTTNSHAVYMNHGQQKSTHTSTWGDDATKEAAARRVSMFQWESFALIINVQRDVTFLPVARAREVAVQLPRPWPVRSPVLTAQVGVPTGMKMTMIVGTGVTAGTVAMRVGGVGETEGTVGWGKV
jgi:hypothetical protein